MTVVLSSCHEVVSARAESTKHTGMMPNHRGVPDAVLSNSGSIHKGWPGKEQNEHKHKAVCKARLWLMESGIQRVGVAVEGYISQMLVHPLLTRFKQLLRG